MLSIFFTGTHNGGAQLTQHYKALLENHLLKSVWTWGSSLCQRQRHSMVNFGHSSPFAQRILSVCWCCPLQHRPGITDTAGMHGWLFSCCAVCCYQRGWMQPIVQCNDRSRTSAILAFLLNFKLLAHATKQARQTLGPFPPVQCDKLSRCQLQRNLSPGISRVSNSDVKSKREASGYSHMVMEAEEPLYIF